MPSSSAIWRMGFSLASWAISISEGTGRRSLSLLGTKPRKVFVATSFLIDALWETAFFAESFALPLPALGDFATFNLALTAIFAPFWEFRAIMENFHKFDK